MIKLEFKINKYHLVHQFLLKYFTEPDSAPKEWETLYKNLEKKYGKDVSFCFFTPKLVGYSLDVLDFESSVTVRVKNKEKVARIFEDIFKTELFRKVYGETEEYKKHLEKEWSENSKRALQILTDITHLNFESKDFTIYVLYPSIENGSYIGENRIEWGFPNVWKNNNTVGLCHEMLHAYTEGYESDTMHALIFLATNEELRCQLNNATEYFEQDDVKTSHEKVVDIEKKLLSAWKEYLSDSDKNFIQLYQTLNDGIA